MGLPLIATATISHRYINPLRCDMVLLCAKISLTLLKEDGIIWLVRASLQTTAGTELWSKHQPHRPLSETLVTFCRRSYLKTDIWLYITVPDDTIKTQDQNDDTNFRTRLNPLFCLQPPYICGFILLCAFIKMQQTYFRQRLFHTKQMTNNNTFNFPSLMAVRLDGVNDIIYTFFISFRAHRLSLRHFHHQNITTQYCYIHILYTLLYRRFFFPFSVRAFVFLIFINVFPLVLFTTHSRKQGKINWKHFINDVNPQALLGCDTHVRSSSSWRICVDGSLK